MQYQKGFTLLELLVVVSILAALAFTTSTGFQFIDQNVDRKLELTELAEVAKAARQFRNDSGYFPGEGVFEIADDTVPSSCQSDHLALLGTPSPAARVNYADVAAYTGSSDCSDNLKWFYHAANLSYLLASQSDGMGMIYASVLPWNAFSSRGWRGPYLNASWEGVVDLGAIENTNTVATGDELTTGSLVSEVPAVFAGGETKPKGIYFQSKRTKGTGYLTASGRPILMFLEKNGILAERMVIVGLGLNGEFDGYPNGCSAKGDDQVICLNAQ